MAFDLQEKPIRCPYCGERIFIEVDPSGGLVQEMVSDCDVCCRPIRLLCSWDEDYARVKVDARRDEAGHF